MTGADDTGGDVTDIRSKRKPASGMPEAGKPASGRPARGYTWESFEPGNTAAMTHGARRSDVALAPRAAELADLIRQAMGDTYHPRFELKIALASSVAARWELAMLALIQSEDPLALGDLDKRASRWSRIFAAELRDLGLTPASAAAIGAQLAAGDVARARLDEHLEAYAIDEGGEPA